MTPEERIIELKQAVTDLRDKIEKVHEERSEILRFFELAIVDTNQDMRIINSDGATDDIFRDAGELFDRGNNLLKVVYKITKSTKEKIEPPDAESEEIDEQADLEKEIDTYVQGPREERVFSIVGENSTGELFMLIWRIRRLGRIFRSYFRKIPSNTIVEKVNEKHDRELAEYERNLKVIFEAVSDGITLLDPNNMIIYMNEAARYSFLSNRNMLLTHASLEGKYFQDIFQSEDPDVLKRRMDYNAQVLSVKKPVSYTAEINNMTITYTVRPMFGEESRLKGLFILSKMPRTVIQPKPESNPKIMEVFKNINEQKNYLLRKNEELNDKLEHSARKARELDSILRLHFTNMENIPAAMSIQSAETGKFEYINSAFEKLFHKNKKQVIDRTDEEILPPEIAVAIAEATEKSEGKPSAIVIGEFAIDQNIVNEPSCYLPRIIRVYQKIPQ
ncbi:MAG: PAS domain-containing protein [Candidatus Kapaibacterium sp.]